MQLERESLAAAGVKSANFISHTGAVAKINFTGQGNYSHGKINLKKLFAGKNQTYFNCGSESHLLEECPHSIYFSLAVARRVGQLRDSRTQGAVHLVLAHLCTELDEPIEEIIDVDNDDNNYIAIFEQMLVSEVDNDKAVCSADESYPEIEAIKTFFVQVKFGPASNKFWRSCIDSGVKRTVTGHIQSYFYINQVGEKGLYFALQQ